MTDFEKENLSPSLRVLENTGGETRAQFFACWTLFRKDGIVTFPEDEESVDL